MDIKFYLLLSNIYMEKIFAINIGLNFEFIGVIIINERKLIDKNKKFAKKECISFKYSYPVNY